MKFRYDVVAAKIPNLVDTALSYIKWILVETLSRVGLLNSPAASEYSPEASSSNTIHFLLLGRFYPMSVPVSDLTHFIKRSLPVISYSSFLIHVGREETADEGMCTVWMEAISGEEEIRELCNCRHVFHRECVDRWVDEGRLSYSNS